MFFNLGLEPDDRFPCHHQLGGMVLSTDWDWKRSNIDDANIMVKGYHDSIDPRTSKFGSFFAFEETQDGIKLHHAGTRSCHIFRKGETLNNLGFGDQLKPWEIPEIRNGKINLITYDALGDSHGKIIDISLNDALDSIEDIIRQNIIAAINHMDDEKITIPITCGLDTGVIVAIMSSMKLNLKLVVGQVVDHDIFTLINYDDIINVMDRASVLSYRQDTNWSAAGGMGDPMFLRTREMSEYFAWHGINILEEISLDDYNYVPLTGKYHSSDLIRAWGVREEIKLKFRSRRELEHHLLRRIINCRCYIWHLGRNMMITPLNDIRIPRILLGLGPELLAKNIRTGFIQREIMQRHSDWLHLILPQQKKVNTYENLIPFMHKIERIA